MITVDEIKSLLDLKPLPEEGGFFKETYRSTEIIKKEFLANAYDGDRSFATAIYYLITPNSFSALHRLPSDEIFHFYLGDPVEMLQLWPDGTGKTIIMGTDILNGMQPQVVVPKGVWQGSRLVSNGSFALLGTTVSPGFDYADYESGQREELIRLYPQYSDGIIMLTS